MNNPFTVQRRSFLQSMGLSLGMTQMLHPLSLLSSANAQESSDDHKALVCINLGGGNDSNNMIVPGQGHAEYDDYIGYRRLPSENADDLPIYGVFADNDTTHFDHLFFNPACRKFQEIFDGGHLACLLNVGNIFARVTKRGELYDELSQRQFPQFYASHSNAAEFWNTAFCEDGATQSGWGGRLAEWVATQAQFNTGASVSPSFSVNSNSSLLAGAQGSVIPYTVRAPGAAPALNDHDYFHADRLADFGAIMSRSAGSSLIPHAPLHADMGRKFLSANDQAGLVGQAFNDTEVNAKIDQAFTDAEASGGLADQLKAVAKLIINHDKIGQDRQFFVVGQGGYDTHSGQLENHPVLLSALANAMMAFRNVLLDTEKFGDTITFTMSDFGRTLVPSLNGTNHAWGGHALIMGERPETSEPGQIEFRPGKYGNYPVLNLDNGSESMSINQEGRYIPQVATCEYAARLAQWFGVDQNSEVLFDLFPELANFYPDTTTQLDSFEANGDLNFLQRVPS